MPYAIHLLGELAESDAEIAKARKGHWKQIDVNGQVAKNFLWVVQRYGQPTLARVSRECFSSSKEPAAVTGKPSYLTVGDSYMRALRAAGLIKTKKNIRGGTLLNIPRTT
jgi:hypothetical protein